MDATLVDLTRELESLRSEAIALVEQHSALVESVRPEHRESAVNLLHYLALRRHDLRALQRRLTEMGLSSLGRCESNVLSTLDSVLRMLDTARGEEPRQRHPIGLAFTQGRALLRRNTECLLGPEPSGREVRILVTASSDVARDRHFSGDLVAAGMDALRVNCAHDDESAWTAMIAHARAAAQAAGRHLSVLMDLPGPKLRTGPLPEGPRVRKIRPQRDALGSVVAPARVLLLGAALEVPPAEVRGPFDAVLPVADAWLDQLRPGSVIEFTDARDKRRRLDVISQGRSWCLTALHKTAYVTTGTKLTSAVEREGDRQHVDTAVGPLPALERAIEVQTGDELAVTLDQVTAPRTVSCTLPQVFALVREGERVLFDDGKISSRIVRRSERQFVVRIERTGPRGGKLGSDKGMNFPDTVFSLPGLTQEDQALLPFVAKHADLIALSFLDKPSDVTDLLAALARTPGGQRLGIVLKIETRRAFEQLPLVLLEALRHPCVGVMIARGDLAVECGFERLAEVQEEILWLCEAAHVPVIWATQVLETLAKTGMPSRAEITDAAMAERAECVMLNKGPHLVAAVRTLDDILRRMQSHQDKKRQTFRSLAISLLRR